MTRVGLEPTTPVFERAKTVHALDRAATVIDPFVRMNPNKIKLKINFSLKSVLNHIPEDFKIKTKICAVIYDLNNKK
jgi:hypothetical protein